MLGTGYDEAHQRREVERGGNKSTETHHLVFCEGEKRSENITGTPYHTPARHYCVSSDVSAGGAQVEFCATRN